MRSRTHSTAHIDRLLLRTSDALVNTTPPPAGEAPLLGVDLGTASVVLVAADRAGNPLACEMEAARVLRDGLVVDYMGAVRIVQRLKTRLERRLDAALRHTAIAVPPGTGLRDAATHRHVVEGCGLEVTAVVDEPTAANEVLGMRDGVVVDVGGGTTGLTVFQGGEAIYSADEPTGGEHISLVLMGGSGISFEEAERRKRDPNRAAEVLGTVKPVVEKMAAIVKRHLTGHMVESAVLVGGTSCLPGIEHVFREVLGVPVAKPSNPLLVTPLGIAMSCGMGGPP